MADDADSPQRPRRPVADRDLVVAAMTCMGFFLALSVGIRVSVDVRESIREVATPLAWGLPIATFLLLALSLLVGARRR